MTDNCKVHIHRQPESRATQVDAFRFILYQPLTERIEITCPPPRTNNSLVRHGQGIFIITLPPGCSTSTPEFLFSFMGNLGTYHHFIAVQNRLNISKYMDGIPLSRFDEIIDQPTADGNQAITIPKINEAFHLKRNWIHRKPFIWVVINTIFYLILFVLLIYIIMMCVRPYQAQIKRCLCPCWKIKEEDLHPGVLYAPANDIVHLNINNELRPTLDDTTISNHPTAPLRTVKPPQLGDV